MVEDCLEERVLVRVDGLRVQRLVETLLAQGLLHGLVQLGLLTTAWKGVGSTHIHLIYFVYEVFLIILTHLGSLYTLLAKFIILFWV